MAATYCMTCWPCHGILHKKLEGDFVHCVSKICNLRINGWSINSRLAFIYAGYAEQMIRSYFYELIV